MRAKIEEKKEGIKIAIKPIFFVVWLTQVDFKDFLCSI